MKPFKLSVLALSLILHHSCTHDSVQKEILHTDEIVHWKPSDGITKYLPSEMLAKFKPEAIEFTERFLINPNERGLTARRNEIHIAAGSSNALTGAIASAGNGDVIVLDPGIHKQQGTVVINKTVYIEGYGATLEFSGVGFPQDLKIAPGIHIKPNGCISTIRGLKFTSSEDLPAVAILLDHTKDVNILSCTFENWVLTLNGLSSDYTILSRNTVKGNKAWQTIPGFPGVGIVFSDGSHNQIVDNEVSDCAFGIFTGGSLGIDFNNHSTSCFLGQILCRVDAPVLIGGQPVSAIASTSNWLVMFNKSDKNLRTGFMVIDGASNNSLEHNTGGGNLIDIELANVTNNFVGYFTPASHDNFVQAYYNVTVKDCGFNNKVIGGSEVGSSVPCMN